MEKHSKRPDPLKLERNITTERLPNEKFEDYKQRRLAVQKQIGSYLGVGGKDSKPYHSNRFEPPYNFAKSTSSNNAKRTKSRDFYYQTIPAGVNKDGQPTTRRTIKHYR